MGRKMSRQRNYVQAAVHNFQTVKRIQSSKQEVQTVIRIRNQTFVLRWNKKYLSQYADCK